MRLKRLFLSAVSGMIVSVMLVLLMMVTMPSNALGASAKSPTSAPSIMVEGKTVIFNEASGIPFVDDKGRTQVPLRKVLEAYGAKVSWDGAKQGIGIQFKGQQISLTIASTSLKRTKGESITMDTMPVLREGKVFLPIQPVVKALGGYVNWHSDVRVVALTSNPNGMPLVRWTFNTDGDGPFKNRQIVVRLNDKIAPQTVANFLALVEKGFYENTPIHRIVPKFIIQGGDPTGTGTGGPGTTIPGEFSKNGFDNSIKHLSGVLSMARKGGDSEAAYNSAGSQFFICLGDQPFLDGQYAAFGEVIEGMDVVWSVSQVPLKDESKPVQKLWITAVEKIN